MTWNEKEISMKNLENLSFIFKHFIFYYIIIINNVRNYTVHIYTDKLCVFRTFYAHIFPVHVHHIYNIIIAKKIFFPFASVSKVFLALFTSGHHPTVHNEYDI